MMMRGWRLRTKAESYSAKMRTVGAVVVMPDGKFLAVGSEVPGRNDTQVWDQRAKCGWLSDAVTQGGRIEHMTREQTEDWRR